MATFNHIGGAEPSTLTFKVATVTQTRNSSAMHQEILTIGDPDSSLALAAVLNTAPASTAWALAVREVSNSTIVSVAALPANSSQVEVTKFPAGMLSTSAPAATSSGLNVWLVGGNGVSTTVSIAALPANSSQVEVRAFPANSSLVQLNAITAGYVSTSVPAANSSGLNVWLVGGNGVSTTVSIAAFPANSSQVEVRALPANSSQVEVRNTVTVTLGTGLQSTVAPSSGSSGLTVRQVWDDRLTVASTNALSSTSFAVTSSAAGIRTYITAYSITSTVAAATKIAFYGGSTMVWPIQLQAVSSGVSGANLSAYPYIFHTDAAGATTLQTPSSVAGVRVAIAYFRAP